ncbi:hypothetical protein [Lewinella cohaerens]|uniref:hypothetical protein n=1 Tax=Lewinella cohaerens TaxID=70995 RepID=UPI0003631C73|nr:hypothetical protein [Lewinella cohaerens]
METTPPSGWEAALHPPHPMPVEPDFGELELSEVCSIRLWEVMPEREQKWPASDDLRGKEPTEP